MSLDNIDFLFFYCHSYLTMYLHIYLQNAQILYIQHIWFNLVSDAAYSLIIFILWQLFS